MNSGTKKLTKQAKILFAGLAVLLIALCFVLFGRGSDVSSKGISYLNTQKEKDIAQIRSDLDALEQAELKAQLEAGTIQIFDMFQDYLILGDSRVVGFDSYGFFPSENVLADAGNTIQTIEERLPVVAERKPKDIIISYGVNDMGLDIGKDEGGYDVVFEQQVKKLLEADPGAHIYINSIIPASTAAVEQSPRWGKVDEFNEKIKAMCERNGWTYIDNTALAAGGTAPIYQPDGVHFVTDFYAVWAKNMYDQMEQAKAAARTVSPAETKKTDSTRNQSEASSEQDSASSAQNSSESAEASSESEQKENS